MLDTKSNILSVNSHYEIGQIFVNLAMNIQQFIFILFVILSRSVSIHVVSLKRNALNLWINIAQLLDSESKF